MAMVNNTNEDIVNRLDAVIGLLIEDLVASGISGRPRTIEILSAGGMGPTEIGKIVGLPTTSVGSILSRQKKQRGTKKARRVKK